MAVLILLCLLGLLNVAGFLAVLMSNGKILLALNELAESEEYAHALTRKYVGGELLEARVFPRLGITETRTPTERLFVDVWAADTKRSYIGNMGGDVD